MLKTGPGTMRTNMTELMKPAISQGRQKALQTIMKQRNVSLADAQYIQASAISKAQLRK